MGNLSGESREQNRKDKVTRFRSVTYARQLGLLVNTLGSHLKYYVVFAVEPFHCVEAFEILTDHVLFVFFMSYFLQAVLVQGVVTFS